MKKITATIAKEWILLRRDIAGFALLFIMPAMLIVVMALVQDAPFRDYQEMRFELLLADNDGGSLAKEIKAGLKESKNFEVIDAIDNRPLNEQQLKELLQKGKYSIGIVIPKGATAEVVNSANALANTVSKKLGLSTLPERETREAYVRMYFDPVSKPAFRVSISNALDKYITYSCSKILVERLSKLSGGTDTAIAGTNFKRVFQGIGLREEPLSDEKGPRYLINSVQHNVPAWAIFGMFFILLPVASHTIREREEGSALRLELIPNAYRGVALGKILFYTIVCTAQFACMLAIGIWLLPHIGLPSLYLGEHAWLLIPLAILIAYSATSFGYFIGAVFKTITQALPFGSISIVLLSAIGGIWVPIELLPQALKTAALTSPLHWALDGVHQVILRNGGITDVVPHMVVLLAFGTIMWLISIYLNRSRRYSF
ncbi:MAG: type transporter [Flavipsychrobacter sp.]|jgi:ABC-2 type transport system permease protein|nr:type transporter [Flavipsychrobacter sp.]